MTGPFFWSYGVLFSIPVIYQPRTSPLPGMTDDGTHIILFDQIKLKCLLLAEKFSTDYFSMINFH